MGNDKSTPPKSTEPNSGKTTKESVPINLEATKANFQAKGIEALKTPIESINAAESIKSDLETVKTAILPVITEASSEMKIVESNHATESPNAGNVADAPAANGLTKMEIATEIYKRMKKVTGITRKEILDEFVAVAKLSKAGASTYYQLIKAKLK
jgi:hypothetical protein